MTNKDYISINRKGVFVGDKPATKYHGQPIANLEQASYVFFMTAGLEKIKEIRVLQSDTYGQTFESGNPEPSKTGRYVWMQAVTEDGTTPWTFRLDGGDNSKKVASLCAFQCAWTINQHKNWVDYLVNAAKAAKAAEKVKTDIAGANSVVVR